jgi:hypothetical protein
MADEKLAWYLATVVNTQLRPSAAPLVNEAMQKIGKVAPLSLAQDLQVLAVRRYLRMQNLEGKDLKTIWAWTAAEVKQSLETRPSEDGVETVGRQLMREAKKVQTAFASANLGYTLGVSPPRSLDRQVKLWVDSLDCKEAGRALFNRAVKELAQPIYDLPAQLSKVVDFSVWLTKAGVKPEPGNAAPGTSDHGQVKAVDFVVMQGARVVAGTSRSTIESDWTAPGWATKLAAATARTRLVGPLKHPYEPWHWSIR